MFLVSSSEQHRVVEGNRMWQHNISAEGLAETNDE
jgi:hypothetical protein